METHTSVTHHRVHFVEGFTPLCNLLLIDTELSCKFLSLIVSLRNELVERRVEKTEGNRLAVHNLECTLDSCLDVWLELCKC